MSAADDATRTKRVPLRELVKGAANGVRVVHAPLRERAEASRTLLCGCVADGSAWCHAHRPR